MYNLNENELRMRCVYACSTVRGLHRILGNFRHEHFWKKTEHCCSVKPGPHQQQCRTNIVECYKVERCFDNVASTLLPIFGNNVAATGNIFAQNGNSVEATFDIVERTKFYNRIVRHCCRLWQQSRMLRRQSRTLLRQCCLLLRHCCWCGWGLMMMTLLVCSVICTQRFYFTPENDGRSVSTWQRCI